MTKPKLFIIAGPNGSGKTTFAEKFLPKYAGCSEFINADLIAKGLSPFNPNKVAIKAGKILLSEINEALKHKTDFGFETTLAGQGYVRTFKRAKKMGYELHLFFLWLPKVDLALARVADRVKKGGHHILTKDVRRRFKRGTINLFQVYEPLLQTWTVFDNSTTVPQLVAKFEKGKLSVLDKSKYAIILKQAGVRHEF